MSAIARDPSRHALPPPLAPARLAADALRDGARGLTLRWSLSAAAACAALPDWPHTGADEVTLEILALDPAFGRVVAAQLTDGRRTLDLAGALRAATGGEPVWLADPDTGLEHLDIPGLLRATFRAAPPTAAMIETPTGPRRGRAVQLLYARTPLFELLGIPGGRYEPVGGEVHGL